jgi:hypothetical protein
MGCPEPQQAKLLDGLLAIHASADQQLGAAPRHFLTCVDAYARTMARKQEELQQQQRFLKVRVGWRGAACFAQTHSTSFPGLTDTHEHPGVFAATRPTASP